MESHGLSRNLRHLRLLLSVAETGSLTHSASILNVSQPAVTQAIGKLERETGGRLFDRTRQGIFPTPRCEVLARRLRRAFDRLDPALTDVAPRLMLTATWAQLQSLVAVHEAENFTLAARRLGLAQPTVHRAISQLEQEAGQSLFERTAFGLLPTRQTRALVQAVMLAFAELDQADSDLSELDGGETGQIVVGSLPLSRSVLLPRALARFREQRPRYPVMVIDGRYDELLRNLRRGEVDLIIGALRQPAPIGDITQVKLFDDHLSVLARRDHPLAGKTGLTAKDLQECKWVVPRRGTPSREHFDALFAPIGQPESIIEAGSILLMRELLAESDHLGCISSVQAQAELSHQLLSELDVTANWPARPIGLTYRENWVPTKAQALLIDIIESEAKTLSI
ncbi:DNA-binding transcriptional regulator, LysR family [Thalassococcus halodurans]|uniref:DNA-binding transcriptional regulator, LysR family n=1 Tax=Thalassococcus halodurans TaxID=373675 RepID=A0A1H6BQS2_9RHOB|nr:LysR family transcriptional regulator [Thalassococcus halodurans]SEG63034.1 DNA-binding transcriptional regulator, LysR family [Thalassococcus halodurans]